MPLQKSYSERINLDKKRQPWQRAHSHPTGRLVTALPPVSDVTKKKLSKFNHIPSHDDAVCEDTSIDPSVTIETKPAPSCSKMSGASSARLDWRDLVEPSVVPEDESGDSPDDKILWDNKQDGRDNSKISPLLARKKKRARSSSPMSSPLMETPKTPAVNIRKLSKAFQSPYADPTLELWDRYSLPSADDTSSGLGANHRALADLMISSSPKPSSDGSTLSNCRNLRRALSCGLLGPKKRKIESLRPGSQNSGKQVELEAASKSSLVNALLDAVTGSFQDEIADDEDVQSQAAPSDVRDESNSTSPKNGTSPKVEPGASDYGDDDFDDETLTELEATMQAAETKDELKAVQPLTEHLASGQRQKSVPLLNDAEFDDFENELLETVELDLKKSEAVNVATPRSRRKKLVGAERSPGDDFGGDFDSDIDFDAVELAATQSLQHVKPSQEKKKPKAKTIQRHLVTSVIEASFVDRYGRNCPEKVESLISASKLIAEGGQILVIRAENSKVIRTVCLRGAWFDTPAHAESYVHVIGEFSPRGQCVVDDEDNLLILHPDQLVSATVVADSFGCLRRAVLQDRVKATTEASPPLVYGTMLHEIFQEALLANRWDLAFLAQLIEKITDKHIEDLYIIKAGTATAREHLMSKMKELSHWAKTFVSALPKPDAVVEDRNGKRVNVAVRKLLDVEEHVWSPMYGLKGNIDATVEVTMLDGIHSQMLTVPFELKTGQHTNSSHMAQTALYTLLLSDRYDIDIFCGILYYMETSKTLRIPAIRHELRHMILQRNQLACYIRERSVQLPPMLKNKHRCGKCFAKTSCFIYHRLADDGTGESSSMDGKFDELVHHLTPVHKDFFIKWENLLTKEEKEGQKRKRELWTMTGSQREKKSRCFADVVIEEGSATVDEVGPRINRFHYAFRKRQPQPGFSFLESEITLGEPIVISDEEGHFALATGFVTSVRRSRICVAVDRRLHNTRTRQPGFDEINNQAFASIMSVAPERALPKESERKIKEAPLRYRLDQDEFSNGMATVRNNLLQLMANEAPVAARIRRLIVDLEAPRFKSMPTQYTVSDRENLNVDQKRAIEKVMSAQDYALVLGMPGTGKTTTIAHIIRALASQGKTVLLTSHTHTAVDNILLKLASDKIPILRLGATAKVHPEVQNFAELANETRKTFEEIKEAWHGTPVVATTCLGINHPVFFERSFDYCIVDEASQITLPICAGPIRMANSFVLVGDHNQLPPVVRNDEAREGGLDVSLFKLLSDAHPESVVNLEHQYRMCEDIMTLSNTLIYDGKLRCGFEELRQKKLTLPNMGSLSQIHYNSLALMSGPTPRSICTGPAHGRCWLFDLLEGEARVRFIDTDTIRPLARETAHGKRIVNLPEVQVVSQIVESLLVTGAPAAEVGVMTHYRAQLSLLKERLRYFPGIEMHTTDRFQGRDKEVVVLSLVRSNEACNIGDLLKDWRRINVAFTRAKTKLLVVGSLETLKHSGKEHMLSRFVTLMEERRWIYHLPADALENHYFPEMSSGMTGTTQSPKAKGPFLSPKKRGVKDYGGKENRRPSPRKARIGEGLLLKGKPITRDILNELTNGMY